MSVSDKNDQQTNDQINLASAVSIGLGAMIGAGIFALVGIAVEIAGPDAYWSFVLAGVLALLTAYSTAKLSVAIPNKGGKVSFINHAFERETISGGFNVLASLGYIVVTSLYARAFGEYSMALFRVDQPEWLIHALSSGIVIIFLLINFFGARLVGKVGLITALIQTAILLFFGFSGLMKMDVQRFDSGSGNFLDILLVTGIIFMSYEGFGLVANTAEDIKKPRKNLPRALYISILIVIVVYTLVTIAVIGNLDPEKIIKAKQYVLAEAAKPIFGPRGFALMGIAALFSTASAINSTIYGPVYMAQETAGAGQLPTLIKKSLWGHESGWALLIYGICILLAVNTLNLKTIAETGSLIFLLIYTVVNFANFKMYEFTKSKRWVSALGIIITLFALMSLVYFLLQEKGMSIYVFGGLIVLSFGFQWLFQRLKK